MNTRQKSLIIHGPVADLGDLLSIARSEGCKVLGCDKVTVQPQVFCLESDYLVVVSPKENGCSNGNSCNSQNKK